MNPESESALEKARQKYKADGWRFGGVKPCNAFGRNGHSVFFFQGEMCDRMVLVKRIPLSILNRQFRERKVRGRKRAAATTIAA